MIEPFLLQYQQNENLTILEKSSWPFAVKRLFFIQNVRKLGIRGNHAHKMGWQFIFPLTGAVDISILNTKGTHAYELDATGQPWGLVVPPMNWLKLRILRPKTIIAVLCSEEYDENDYVRDIKVYTERLKNEHNSIQQSDSSTCGTKV